MLGVERWTFSAALCFPRSLRFFNQFPELARLSKRLILCHRQFAAEQEIAKRVLVQDAVYFDPFVGLREIDAVIFRAVAIQLFAAALDHTETFGVEMIEVLGQNLKFSEKFEL